MKKCPYCAEEIQDEAIVCRYCGRELTTPPKQYVRPQEEVTYLNQADVKITNTRAILSNKTYSMANITSVSVGEVPPNKAPGYVLLIIGFTMMLGFFAKDSFCTGMAVFGILLAGAGAYAASTASKSYVVRIGSASGESNALSSQNGEYIQQIVDAMNKAIIDRG